MAQLRERKADPAIWTPPGRLRGRARQPYLSSTARLVCCTLLAIAATFCLPSAGRAEGVITHDAIVQRAIDLIEEDSYPDLVDLLHDYPGVVYYGAMFPDWAYGIGEGDLAELAHDAASGQQGTVGPFRAALTANLLESFRNPTSEDDRKAIAFLLGLISHDDADIPYHFGDGTAPGLQPLAEEAGIPHWALELGSDLYLAPTLKHSVEGFLPEDALLAAYQIVDSTNKYHVNATLLHIGRAIHLGQFTLETVAAVVVDPCLVFGVGQCREADQEFYALIENYTPGGVAQCAGRAAGEWQKTWDWLITYKPVTAISMSPARPDGDAYRQPVTVTLSPTDNFNGWIDTGPFAIQYSLDGGSTYLSYTAPFVIDSEGVHQISVYSVDSQGNSESAQNLTLTIGD